MQRRDLRRLTILTSLLLLLSLVGCDSNDSDDNGGNASSSSSTSSSSSSTSASSSGELELGNVQVHFPPPVSTTQDGTVTVRGVVEDPTDVASVWVEGQQATTSDDWLNWQLSVPLADGENRLQVSYQDNDGNVTDVAQVQVEKRTNLVDPDHLVLDAPNNRLLVFDRAQGQLVGVDVDSGDTSLVSSSSQGEDLLTRFNGMILDHANNQVVVYQLGETPFVRVDLTSGAQSALEAEPFPNYDLQNTPRAMAADPGGVAYVADVETIPLVEVTNDDGVTELVRQDESDEDDPVGIANAGFVYRMNLDTGATELLSNFDTPSQAPVMGFVKWLTTDAQAELIYALEYHNYSVTGFGNVRVYSIVSIHKDTGQRSRVFPRPEDDEDDTDGEGDDEGSEEAFELDLAQVQQIELDYENATLYALSGSTTLATIDLNTGAATLLADSDTPEDADLPLTAIEAIALDTQNQWTYTVDDAVKQVLRIDNTTGLRTRVSAPVLGSNSADTAFATPLDITLDIYRERAYVSDAIRNTVYSIDMATGEKSALATQGDPEDENEVIMIYPVASTLTPEGNLLVLSKAGGNRLQSTGQPRIIQVDTETGEKSGEFFYGFSGVEFRDIVLDPASGRYFVAEIDRVGNSSDLAFIRRLDLSPETPTNTAFSGYGIPDTERFLRSLRGLAMDNPRNRILASDSGVNALIAVDNTTGKRTMLSGQDFPVGDDIRFSIPVAVVTDEDNNRALVLDSASKAIIAVDLDSGRKALILENSPEHAEKLFSPKDLELHPVFHYVLVVDDTRDSVLAIDLVTNERVTIAY